MAPLNVDLRHFYIIDSFSSIEEYFNIAKEIYNAEQKKYHRKISKYIDTLRLDNDDESLRDLYSEIIESRDALFYSKLYYSLIIMIYSSIEHNMYDLCKYIKSKQNYEIDVKDIKGNGIFQCIKYLEKVCFINFRSINISMNEFHIINKIRNGIIHNNGIIASSDLPQVKKYIGDNNDMLFIDSYNTIGISEKYIKMIISTSKDILENIYLHLKKIEII